LLISEAGGERPRKVMGPEAAIIDQNCVSGENKN